MNFRKHISLLFALLYSICNIVQTSKAEVVYLTDENFEHQTQASTGMTTGSWLIFFKAKRCPHCNKLMPHYESLSQDEELMERGIVLAMMDVNDCPAVMNRFMIRGFPTLIFLHQKKLYEYSGRRDYEPLKEFVLNGFQNSSVEAKSIPPPPSALGYYIKLFTAIGIELRDAAMGKSGATGYAILVLVGMLVSMFGMILSMFFMPAKAPKKKTKKN
jgi:thiol-disulfide isomerase/thioredoxin